MAALSDNRAALLKPEKAIDRHAPKNSASIYNSGQMDEPAPSPDVVRITHLLESDDPQSSTKLLPLVYDQLRDLARARLARQEPGHTLQPTALVHEAFLRIAGSSGREWAGRRHFFAAAAESMRCILIDQARRKSSLKRGGGQIQNDVPFEGLAIEPPDERILEVDEALNALEAADPKARAIVNLRYFSGLTTEETAEALGVSASTVAREWRFIRSFLADALDPNPNE